MDAVVLSRLLNSRKTNEVAAARAAFAQAGPPAADIVANVLECARKRRERRARLIAPLVNGGGLLTILTALGISLVLRTDMTDVFRGFYGDWDGSSWPSMIELEAANLLARWGDIRATDTLLAALDDPQAERAEAARRALAELLTGLDERTAAMGLTTEHGGRLRRLLTEETSRSRPAHPDLALAVLHLLKRACVQPGCAERARFHRLLADAGTLKDVERLSSRATDSRVRAACVDCLPGLRAVVFGLGSPSERIGTP